MQFSVSHIDTDDADNLVSQSFEVRLGACIRRRRFDSGIDITSLADEISVSVIRFMGFETGAIRPTADEVYDIATALGVTITRLFEGAILHRGGRS